LNVLLLLLAFVAGAIAMLVALAVVGAHRARRKAGTASSVSHVKESVCAVVQTQGGLKRVIN
jgi:hypothetical protein